MKRKLIFLIPVLALTFVASTQSAAFCDESNPVCIYCYENGAGCYGFGQHCYCE